MLVHEKDLEQPVRDSGSESGSDLMTDSGGYNGWGTGLPYPEDEWSQRTAPY